MIRIKIKNKKFIVPNDFKELTIGKYQELNKIKLDEKKDILDYINILTGISKDMINLMDIGDVKNITDNLLKFFDKEKYDLVDAVKIEKDTYVFDRNLDSMRFEMFIDLEELTKDQDSIIDNLHIIMAILYRPMIKKRFYQRDIKEEEYNSINIKQRAEFFKDNMMMDKVLGALFFFINLRTKYITTILDYSTNDKKTQMETMI